MDIERCRLPRARRRYTEASYVWLEEQQGPFLAYSTTQIAGCFTGYDIAWWSTTLQGSECVSNLQ